MIISSINSRLLISLSLFIALSLGLSGFALDSAFRSSVETALEEKLKAHFYTLLADTDASDNELLMPEQLKDPLFNQIDSGLYAVINDQQGNELWRSPSAIALQTLPGRTAQIGSFEFNPPDSSPFYRLSYGIIWELENDGEQQFHLHLLQNAEPVTAQMKEFRTSLWQWFVGIAVILLLLQGAIMRWGLSPLRGLAQELQAIESGQQSQLTGCYPIELKNVTQNLNLLIDHERSQRQRYRDTLADLAHSLKTPLSILRGLNNTSPDAAQQNTIDEQIRRMDDIINHQLQRASHKASSTHNPLSMPPLELAELSDKLLRSLHKVYADKHIHSENQIDHDTQVRADARDLMEVLGNLLDNAFKACQQQVRISARRQQSTLLIYIEDDGEGIPQQRRQQVLKRGGRADTRNPGQGIGLAVALDILNSYQAQLRISDSELGGAKFEIILANQ